jgi:hypothetical protein
MTRKILLLLTAMGLLANAAQAETTIALPIGHRIAGKWYRETLANGTSTVAHFLGQVSSVAVLPPDGRNLLGDEWETPDGRGWVWSLSVYHGAFSTDWLGTAEKEPLAAR